MIPITNDDKKKYLMSYGQAMKTLIAYEAEYRTYCASLTGRGISYHDHPSSGRSLSDLSDMIITRTGIEDDIRRAAAALTETRRTILAKIDACNVGDYKLILQLRYINMVLIKDGGYATGAIWRPWAEVAAALSYTTRHVTRLHGIALGKLDISEDDIAAMDKCLNMSIDCHRMKCDN